jgi:hypothetical protein
MAVPPFASLLLIAAAAALQPAPDPAGQGEPSTAAVEQAADEAAENAQEAAEAADEAAEAASEAAEQAAAESQPDEPEVCRRTHFVDDFGRSRSRKVCRPRSEWGPR